MTDYLTNGLTAAIKSLEDVIGPAIDPSDPLACEQVRLTLDFLHFLRSRLPYVVQAQQLEVQHYLAMAQPILELLPDGPEHDALSAAMAHATAWPSLSVEDRMAVVEEIATAICASVERVGVFDSALFEVAAGVVHEHSLRHADFERSWYAPLAVDPGRDALPPFTYYLNGEQS
jgi:hypothetical protein